MKWEKWGAIGSIAAAVLAIVAVIVTYLQLDASVSSNFEEIRVLKAQIAQSKASVTMQAVSMYLHSPQLDEKKRIINAGTKNGSDYSAVSDDKELYNAVQGVLNYLETIATGIESDVYDDRIVCQSLKLVVQKQVEVHIHGQHRIGVDVPNPRPFSESEFGNLVKAYKRWNQAGGCPP